MILHTIISGGQTGADQAGLFAARECGLETGGFAPRGWRTVLGPEPDLANFYLVELSSTLYPPRTARNIQEADGTIRFASNFDSTGEKCTLRFLEAYGKPYLDIALNGANYEAKAKEVAFFIRHFKIRILNVAGNADRDHRFGRHFRETKGILVAAIKMLREEE